MAALMGGLFLMSEVPLQVAREFPKVIVVVGC
jgi:hypothetical protein